MKRIFVFVTAIALSLGASGVSLAQNNPFIGKWTLNLAKSKFIGTQAPKSETRTVVARGDGEEITYAGMAADGSSISYSITTHLDGKEAPYSGRSPFGADTVTVKRIDANTHTSVSKKAGKTLFTTRTAVSKDGKVSIQRTKGTDDKGQPISVTTVWDKQ
jgi:hypothetical protein